MTSRDDQAVTTAVLPRVPQPPWTSDFSQDPEEPSRPRPESPPQPGPNAPPTSKLTNARRRLAHYAGLVLASMIGCLIRLGLDALADYDGQAVFFLAWAQGVGCGIMGLALDRRSEITELYPPLYTFFTTGVAGSVTTFSSWMLGGYEAFANTGGFARGGLYNTVDGFAYSFVTFAVGFGGLYFGEHFSRCLPSLHDLKSWGRRSSKEKLPEHDSITAPSPAPSLRPTDSTLLIMDYITIASAFVAYFIALLLYFLAPVYWRHRATFPILLSPPGAILRFYLSNLNTQDRFVNRFPLGTFIANISGTLVLGGVYAAQFLPTARDIAIQCDALNAIQQGFCGCLTTVSTFVVESRSVRSRKWTWIYVGSSVVLGHVCILVTFGAVGWASGRGGICTGS